MKTVPQSKQKGVIGLGMAALGRPGYINLGHADDLEKNYDATQMQRHAHEVLDAAWAAGVRYFDTARSYGLAEKFLGSWLHDRKIARDKITVASKWGYTYTANWQVKAAAHEIKDHSLPVLRRQWKESKELLGDYLQIYQIHSATLETGVLENTEVLNELAQLKRQKVQIGLTVTGPQQATTLQRALDVTIDGVGLFDAVQATWNLLETSVGPALLEARHRGLRVIIKEAMANGRLTDRNQSPTFAPKLAQLKAEAARLNCSLDALALSACLAQPFVDVVLSGAATVEHLRSNLTALSLHLDTETLSRLQSLAQSPEEYWNERKSLEWN